MLEKRKDSVARSAQPHLEQGEAIRALVMCQTRVPALLTAIAGFLAKVHAVVVTERNVYLLPLKSTRIAEVEGVGAKHAIGSVEVSRGPGTITVGDARLWVLVGAKKDAEQVVATASTGESADERESAARGEPSV